ncbi:MAG: UbiH/UbiF family hydroxylase [Rhizobiaceae bacterium]|nr:UbiH/UbiF family hydroxylase [Rhizobiaceae bacterium]
MARTTKHKLIIAGGGLAGLTLANAVAQSGINVALVAPVIPQPDGRTTALLAHSVDYLKKINVWERALPKTAAMTCIRIIDDTRRLLHAPEILFKSSEIELDQFGFNIQNKDLSAALTDSLKKYKNFSRIDGKISDAVENDENVSIILENGEKLECEILVGADGRNSTVRKLAEGGSGIAVRQWRYPQSAIVLNFSHTLPHDDTSTEFHNSSGPFTIVPLETNISSLVWVVKPEMAEEIMSRQHRELELEIEQQMHSILGKIKIVTDIQSFPLSAMNAKKMASGRFFLVGDAGHVFPPIGAQGYNLGIRDIEDLAAMICAQTSERLAVENIASRYNAKRRGDVLARTVSVDLLNRSLLSDFLPVQLLRTSGIIALTQSKTFRKMMMREGVSPGTGFGTGYKVFGEALQNIPRFFQPSKNHS